MKREKLGKNKQIRMIINKEGEAMQNIRDSILLKFLCYILIPIMIFVLAISIIDISITSQYGEMDGPEEYIETEEFGREYLATLISNVQDINRDKRRMKASAEEVDTSMDLNATETSTEDIERENPYDNYSEIEDESYEYPVYYESIQYNNTRLSPYINYIIIDKENGNMFTNIRSNNYPEEINKLKAEKTNWSYQDGNITTNITSINQESAKYITSSYYSVDNF